VKPGAARADGRRADELRAVRLVPDFTEHPLGSVLAELGRTRVLCTVCEELAVPRHLLGQGRGWITAEYSMLPGATEGRSEREVTRGRPSGRTQEIQRLIGRSLRAVTDLGALGERAIYIDCDVLQADGGTRTAAITGGYVALAAAFRRMVEVGMLKAVPLHDSVAAVSVGIVDGEILLDLPYAEDSRAEVDMNVVQLGSGRLVEVQGTGEGGTFDRKLLDRMLDVAERGIGELARIQSRVLGA